MMFNMFETLKIGEMSVISKQFIVIFINPSFDAERLYN